MKLKLALAMIASMLAACGDGTPSPPKDAAKGASTSKGPAHAQFEGAPKEIALTADHIRRFIAHKTDARLLNEKLMTDGKAPDAGALERFGAASRELVKKHGFDSQEGYNAMWTIATVLSSFDRQSPHWVDPRARYQSQIEAVRKQDGLSDENRKLAIKHLEDGMALVTPVSPANVKLITEHYDALRKAVTGR